MNTNEIKMNNLNDNDLIKFKEAIETEIKKTHGFFSFDYATLFVEYPLGVRDTVAKYYKDINGYAYAYHATTSELGLAPGLTSFRFSNVELKIQDIEKYHKI